MPIFRVGNACLVTNRTLVFSTNCHILSGDVTRIGFSKTISIYFKVYFYLLLCYPVANLLTIALSLEKRCLENVKR